MPQLDVSKIRLICFDVDGTLSDSDNQMANRVEKVLKPFQFLFSRHTTPRRLARRMIMAVETPGNWALTAMDALQLDELGAAVSDFLHRHGSARHRLAFWLIPGVKQTLEKLSAAYPLAVVSARGDEDTWAFLHQYQLEPFFRLVVTAQTCPHTKPYPHPLLFAARQMGVQPDELLMVGDTTVDIRSARSASAQSVGVLCGFGTRGELERAGAGLILPQTNDLLQILIPDGAEQV